jgi:hypothetical protein
MTLSSLDLSGALGGQLYYGFSYWMGNSTTGLTMHPQRIFRTSQDIDDSIDLMQKTRWAWLLALLPRQWI